MASIHGHEVLHMILSSKVAFTQRSLIEAIHQRFGEEARFHTCSAENMTAAELTLIKPMIDLANGCLLYTSDAADDALLV